MSHLFVVIAQGVIRQTNADVIVAVEFYGTRSSIGHAVPSVFSKMNRFKYGKYDCLGEDAKEAANQRELGYFLWSGGRSVMALPPRSGMLVWGVADTIQPSSVSVF
ncbi:hypothetical protein AVEN_116278-1 [Araneus ventricosus]|uniref:Uncharacterized protein n=1 Tax=Araneus ventricosus TaxID=182803 RepID=A0A4Y2PVC1_ARAVE|nr:hypothetical protein AVEN_116278-1 [Araneus ventricosus]